MIALAVLAFHGWISWSVCGGWQTVTAKLPILVNDHPSNYYATAITPAFYRQSGTNAGYDPNFMAGYSKSIIFPPSSTLPEVLVWLFGTAHPARVFNTYVVGTVVFLPMLLWLAALVWRLSNAEALAALVLFLVWFWTDWGFNYVYFGMVSFVLGGPLALLATGLFVHWIDNTSGRWRSAGWWGLAACSAALMALTHVSTPIVALPIYSTAYLLAWPRCSPTRHAGVALLALFVVAANSFWLLPGIALLETRGSSDAHFVNPELAKRMWELVCCAKPWTSAIVALLIVGIFIRRQEPKQQSWPLLVGTCWAFLVGYPLAALPDLYFLQPGRYTYYFFAIGSCIAAAVFRSPVQRRWFVFCGAAWGALFVWAGFWLAHTVAVAATYPTTIFPVNLTPEHQEVIDVLKRHAKPGERVLFEDRNRGSIERGLSYRDPFGNYRLAPIVPLLTGLELVGGPHQFVHLKTNFTQFGDGKFLGGAPLDAETFLQYWDAYDLQWIVCWSPPAINFCRANSRLFDVVAKIGEERPIIVARINRTPSRTFVGQAEIAAQPGGIHVKNAQPHDGILVLSYHWTPGLVCDPPARISELRIGNDPVGMICVHDPPTEFSIHLDPWQRWR